MSVCFLFPYPLAKSPSQRFRFEQYRAALEQARGPVRTQSFYDDQAWKVLYTKGDYVKKILGLAKGYLRRTALLFTLSNTSHVFIHRELAPFGPPVFEWIIAKVLKKKIIYDFDDAIWHTDIDKKQWLKIWLKNPGKTNRIIKWSWKVSCGNAYLCEHARQFNSQVMLNPTTIDTENLHNAVKDQKSAPVVVGWTGSHSTLKYLEPMVPLIRLMEKERSFEFMVICDQKPQWDLSSLTFLPWNKNTEIEDLKRFNFGLMPLPNDEWSKGKCGFKALQYMALGMPAIVSPVGVNTEIVTHGVDGYICESVEEWEKAIKTLLADESLRTQMGKEARKKVIQKYSVLSNTKNFLSLFN